MVRFDEGAAAAVIQRTLDAAAAMHRRVREGDLDPVVRAAAEIALALGSGGKVLAFGGSCNDDQRLTNPYEAELWDSQTGECTLIDQKLEGDVFCVGHAFLPDGRLLAAGGTCQYDNKLFGILPFPPFTGLNHAYAFDPVDERWERVQDMAYGRWYPTLLTLGDGRVLKTDGDSHGDGPLLPGPCDICWDLAGAIIEWNMNRAQLEQFILDYVRLSGDRAHKRLPAYLLAYCAQRLGETHVAARGSDPDERVRLRNAQHVYRDQLAHWLTATSNQPPRQRRLTREYAWRATG